MANKITYYILGTLLSIIGAIGILGNALVLLVFTRFRRLRGPFSTLIVNLAVGDLGTSFLHIMAIISSFKGKWAFGYVSCVLYGFGVGFFGMLSVFTLAAIAVERYMVITAKPLSATWKMTQQGARRVCAVSWLYSTSLTLPPIFGWSCYLPEGLLTSCSWDYTTKSVNNTSYYIYLLTFGFCIPVSVIIYCYSFIIIAILAHGKEMAANKIDGQSRYRVTSSSVSSAIRTAEIIMVLVAMFLVSWTPYAIITVIGQFGDPQVITPIVAALPAYFAKMSVIYNPIVYGLSHPHFRSSVRQYVSGCTLGSGASSGNMMVLRQPGGHEFHYSPGANRSHSVKVHQEHFRCFPRKLTQETAIDIHTHSDADKMVSSPSVLEERLSGHWPKSKSSTLKYSVNNSVNFI